MKFHLMQYGFIVSALFAGQVMAQSPAAPAAAQQLQQCMLALTTKHNQVMQSYAAASKAGRIDANERKAFADLENRYRAAQGAASKDGFSMQECTQLHQMMNRISSILK
jgi:hypothetical protein